MQKRRALITDDGFPLNIVMQGNGNESARYGGLVLEQEYGSSYTGNVSYIDPVGLAEGVMQLELWNLAISEAGYVEATTIPANVMHTRNRYAFEEEIKVAFSSYL